MSTRESASAGRFRSTTSRSRSLVRGCSGFVIYRAKLEGFLVTDYSPRFAEGLRQLSAWFSQGKLKYAETIEEGLENAPRAFIGMLQGKNLGKQLVKVSAS